VKKIKLIILRNEQLDDHLRWVAACHKYSDQADFEIVDLTRNDWLERVVQYQPDMLLTKPGGLTSSFKQLYDERLMILSQVLGFACYPSLDEVLIYENKRYFSYWLRVHQLPHPQTHVFYFQDEAVEFVKHAAFPLVAKVNIGASGSGVKLLHNSSEVLDYIKSTFSGKGAAKRSGPNLQKGGLIKRGLHYVMHPGKIAGQIGGCAK